MITVDGWLDWAIRLIPSNPSTNIGVSSVRGVFMHSAEGYASVLLDPNSQWGYNGNHSWHISNLMDGRVFQHYPLTARCHHATAANQEYVGVENEGDYPKELSLNDLQIANAVRFLKEIGEWKGWEPTRTGNTRQTLWEHNEVVWLGGTGSSCPSGRIPWDKILAGINAGEDEMFTVHDHWATFFEGLKIKKEGWQAFNAWTDFGVKAKRYRVEFMTNSGYCVVWHAGNRTTPYDKYGGKQAGRLGWPDPALKDIQVIEIEPDEWGWCSLQAELGPVEFSRAHCIGYYT